MFRDFNYDIYPSEKYENLYYADAWSDSCDRIIYAQGKTHAEAESNIKKEIEEYLDLFG